MKLVFNKSLEFDRNQILTRYWELANLDPRTKPRETLRDN